MENDEIVFCVSQSREYFTNKNASKQIERGREGSIISRLHFYLAGGYEAANEQQFARLLGYSGGTARARAKILISLSLRRYFKSSRKSASGRTNVNATLFAN